MRQRDMASTRVIPTTRGINGAVSTNANSRGQVPRSNSRNSGAKRPPQGTHASNRTGAAPYLHGQSAYRRPQPKKRKDPLYIIILRWIYFNRRAAAVTLGLFLVVTIAIPLAVFAASTADDGLSLLFGNLDGTAAVAEESEPDGIIDLSDSMSANKESEGNVNGQGTPAETGEPDETSGEENSVQSPGGQESDTTDTADSDAEDEPDSSTAENNTATEPEETTESTSGEVTDEPEPETTDQFPVTISFFDRESISCYTEPATLRQILLNEGYTIRDSDVPTVPFDTMIEGETWIMIDSHTYKTVTESEVIPFETERYESQTVPRGTTKTVSHGVNGSKDKVYTVEYINGAEVSRNFEYEYVASYPTNQIDYYGIGGTFYAPDGTMYSYSYKIEVRATYYSIHGNTSIGLPTGDNVMAVDPSVIPLGSSVYVMNDYYDMGIRIAADTGGAVKGNIIDLWMSDGSPYYYEFASQGVHSMTAYVLD